MTELTSRQVEIINKIAQGKSYKQIAGELGISLSVVKVHLSKAYKKLGGTNRAGAVMHIMKNIQ
jgi:DNA-binding NarL/FixJ family response regulator